MAWIDQLRPASFRGVPFDTTSLESEVGRDGVVQEPAGADGVYFDDQGRKGRRFNVDAYILPAKADGSDYANRRDALLAAVEEEGAGSLVHPTFGTLKVQCLACNLTESMDAGRVASFRLQFVEVGERPFPSAKIDRPTLSLKRSAVVKADASTYFEDAWDAVGQLDYVVSRGVDQIQDRIDELYEYVKESSDLLDDVSGTLDKIDKLGANLATLASTPADLAEDIVDLMDGVGHFPLLTRFAAGITPPAVSSSNPNDIQAETNARSAALLLRVAATAAAVDATAAEEFTSFDDATRARDDLVDIIGIDEERDDVTGDLYEALVDMRIGLWDDLTERALELPSIVEYTPSGMTSAVELAQLLYQDGSRAAEIVERNDLPHSGFIPPLTLRVLSR